jgi:hypothetical protein
MAKPQPLQVGDIVSGGDGLCGVVTKVELEPVWGQRLSGPAYVMRVEQQVYVDWRTLRLEVAPNT